ncbi:hypothetical protein [Commensalibacter melissae]|uniref:hypothetical protein n=1 Tax=Commensalibacter melissae TaxID=2070537 RepID=UPI0012D94298|nr:hypothetical protein [Commensalibacter melissae]MUG81431.1 hypothetical protein [Commensalibacter melissae]
MKNNPRKNVQNKDVLNIRKQDAIKNIKNILEKSVTDPRDKSVALSSIARIEHYSGPIPSPDQMKEYAGIDGAIPTILRMAEKEQSFRHKIFILQTYYPYIGLVFAFVLIIVYIAAACYIANLGYGKTVLILLGGGGVFSLISLMIKIKFFPFKKDIPDKQINSNNKKQ